MIEITGKSRCDVRLEPYDKASESHEIIITVQSFRDAHSFIYVSISLSVDLCLSVYDASFRDMADSFQASPANAYHNHFSSYIIVSPIH